MSSITRTWLAFAAFGAGLIHLALVVSSPLPVACVLVAVGFVELGWAVLTLSRDRLAAPRIVLAASLVPTLLWGLDVAAAAILHAPAIASFLGFRALAASTVLELFVAVVLAVQLRRGVDLRAATRMPSAGRYLVGLFAGALVVGAIIAPALSVTDAGRFAQPMGDMQMGGMQTGSDH